MPPVNTDLDFGHLCTQNQHMASEYTKHATGINVMILFCPFWRLTVCAHYGKDLCDDSYLFSTEKNIIYIWI